MSPSATVEGDTPREESSDAASSMVCLLQLGCGLRNDGLDIDLYEHLRQGETVDDQARAAGEDSLQVAPDHSVDGFAIGAIGDVGRDLADMLHLGAGLLEQHLHVLHGLIG